MCDADTIRKDENPKWFHIQYPYGGGSGGFAPETKSIELFRIQYEGKYLTVLDETEFPNTTISNTVVNTQLGWVGEKLNDKNRVRQYFAIVRNYVDSSIAFLPVASYKWKLENGAAKYENGERDTLSFNLQIGRHLMEDGGVSTHIADLAGTWYISYLGKVGAMDKLVIADSIPRSYVSLPPRVWFDLKSSLKEWEGKEGYVTIKQVRENKYYTDIRNELLPNVTANDATAHWLVKKDTIDDKTVWSFAHVIEDAPNDFYPMWRKDTDTFVCVFADSEDNLYVTNVDQTAPSLDTVRVGYIDEEFSLFDHWEKQYNGKIIPPITILSSTDYYENRGISVGPEMQDGIYEASYVIAEEYPAVSVEKHKGKFHLDREKKYEIFYYQFSRKDDDDNKYVLGIKNDTVNWTLSDEIPEDSTAYWFAIPKVSGKEGVCYLQSLDHRVIKLKGDGSGLNYLPDAKDTESSHYEVIALYTNPVNKILPWKFEKVDPFKNREWVSINESLLKDSLVNGVLTAEYYAVGATFVSNDKGKGVLSNNKADPIELKFKMVENAPQNIIAYSKSEATAVSKERTYYHIMQNDSYLMDNGGGAVASFGGESQKFSFMVTDKEADEFLFAIVSDNNEGDGDDPRFLSSRGTSLVFETIDRGDLDGSFKLDFQWGKLSDYSGIKAITVSGKIYGVAGGVKVSGATGAVAIYTVDGRLVTKETVTSPNQTIAVPAGIYVVKSGAEVTKVVVK